jgi:mercuric ion transport protein
MKVAYAAVAGSLGASVCCIGPVVFTLFGAGTLAAASVRLEPYRPWFIGATIVAVAAAFYTAYRPRRFACGDEGGACDPGASRSAKILAWLAAVLAALLVAFPYYVGWFV